MPIKKNFKSFFDKIYIINLNTLHGKEKLKKFKQTKFFNNKIEIFKAFNGKTDDYQKYIDSGIIKKQLYFKNYKLYTNNNIIKNSYKENNSNNQIYHSINLKDGEIGINITTYLIAKNIIENNYKNVLVFEDDAIDFHPDFENLSLDFIKKLPHDWEIGLLGYFLLNQYKDIELTKSNNIHPSIMKVKNYCLQHCYCLNQKAAKKIINTPISLPIELYFSKHFNVYCHNHFTIEKAWKSSSLGFHSKLIKQKSIHSEIDYFGGHSGTIYLENNNIFLSKNINQKSLVPYYIPNCKLNSDLYIPNFITINHIFKYFIIYLFLKYFKRKKYFH